MIDVLSIIGGSIMWAWWFPSMFLFFLPNRPPPIAGRLSRALCIPAFCGYLAGLLAGRDGITLWLWLILEGVWPLAWWIIHRQFHQDRHGRRLLDAATGWVRRRGNRLAVVPATGGAS
ncbi:MAG TPA: hypothetical protein VHA75_01135 [Rugosimonospora sp.]|nr:hypothetical protein [Rugosimonospora sp.]